MLEHDGASCAFCAISNVIMGAVVENHAVHEAFNQRSALVVVGFHHAAHRSRHIHVERTSEERAAGTEAKFSGDKRTFNRAERRGLRNESLR